MRCVVSDLLVTPALEIKLSYVSLLKVSINLNVPTYLALVELFVWCKDENLQHK